MRTVILLFHLLVSVSLFAQNPEYFRVNKQNKLVVLKPQDNGNMMIYQMSGLFESAKKVIYQDSASNYEVLVPRWLHLKETNSLTYFGGTLPAINTVENAIVINAVQRDSASGFSEFRKYVIEDSGYVAGSSPPWDKNRTFISISKVQDAPGYAYAYKLSVNLGGHIFVCNFVLIETKTAYLWVQFVATEETYDQNIEKFYEFLKGIRLL